ncbi:uncharacterized protein BDR25DRAFT_306581 [Lindgomyces ingoldianus]|uniref:Uncharacterized protein n=1 Tax=Lindgomyces ingoldianus TaxID=673940 RepID=A0ACB6QEU6_9PLEO|nr:uncharacterized protein BDR25DRAFT_306581 [Lindgomyces ingoldianus]KAF2465422.1 hypothetical protein BDR25DRAFT_306581 [Lindgomyces ingoldianus]
MLDMLTADAASKHGHEYSPPRPSPSSNGSFFTQSPLSILTSILRKPAAPGSPVKPAANTPKSPVEGPSPTKHQDTHPMTEQPDAPTLPTPLSRPASSSSIASTEGKPKKRSPRPKTTYNLAQPPPITGPRQKLHLRPKVLLQLHQVIASRRPKPVYEVIPFSLLAPRSTRRLARTFNTKEKLCPNDLLIVKVEEYDTKDEDEKSDDERWGARDVIGIICPGKDDKGGCVRTEVCMDDGSSWEVTGLPNGGYEFCYTDEHGLLLKRRWVPKTVHSRRVSTMSSSSQASPSLPVEEKRFNFSTISATSRRHPVIANLNRACIDVLDSYMMPSATSPPTPGYPGSSVPTPLVTPSSFDNSYFTTNSEDRLPVKTDDALRSFIIVSGIWVAFSENWSPAYTWSKTACPSPLSTAPSPRPSAPSRAMSMSLVDSPRSASPASTIDENRRTFPKFFRTGTQILHRHASFTNSSSSTPTSTRTSPVSSPLKTRSRRSNSTGTAELTPKTGSARKRFGLALEDQTLAETEEERQSKRSTELLRIKELSLPSSQANSPVSTPGPVQILEPPRELFRSPSPTSPSLRPTKTQSAYNPITTAGLWDSGVAEGSGLKSRPTSLVVVNEKKERAKKKQERSKSKEKNKDQEKEKEKDPRRFKQRFLDMFRREKSQT